MAINIPNDRRLLATMTAYGFNLQYLGAIFDGSIAPQSRDVMVAICKDYAKATGQDVALAMDGRNLVMIRVFANGQSELLWNFGEVPERTKF